MKKIIVLVFVVLVAFSCKEEENNDPIYEGEFIHVADAAVLKGSNFIYGVVLNDISEELAAQVALVKKDDFDMVPVVIKGKLSKKPKDTEGWDEQLTITEIVKVSSTPSEADIKIDSKKE